jgi:RimJ/RimL family protein N-acetyltransferase
MTESDLPSVEAWLRLPHVARWWTPDTTAGAEIAKYRERVRQDQPATHLLMVTQDGTPAGWCQWYRWADHPADAEAIGAREGEIGIDYAIGDPAQVGRGAGTTLIATLVTEIRRRHPGAGILADPDAANRASRRVLEKNGFHLVAVRPVATEASDAPMAIYRLPSAAAAPPGTGRGSAHRGDPANVSGPGYGRVMADIPTADLRGARFDRADLTGAQFFASDLSGARFRGVDMSRVTMRGVELADVDIDGEISNVTVNGVAIGPLIEAELDRRHPDRVKMRPDDPDGFREAWEILGQLWDQTVTRARRLPPELLYESVDGEWSFTETLRHLVFATDVWVRRAIGGDPSPWHPLGLPMDEGEDMPGVPRDRDVRPPLDVVLALRRDRMSSVATLLAGLTEESLAADTTPVEGPGWPRPHSYPVRECLLIVLNEEWSHRQFAERDLAVLESRATG